MSQTRKTEDLIGPTGAGWHIEPKGRTAWIAIAIRPDGQRAAGKEIRLTRDDVVALQYDGYHVHDCHVWMVCGRCGSARRCAAAQSDTQAQMEEAALSQWRPGSRSDWSAAKHRRNAARAASRRKAEEAAADIAVWKRIKQAQMLAEVIQIRRQLGDRRAQRDKEAQDRGRSG